MQYTEHVTELQRQGCRSCDTELRVLEVLSANVPMLVLRLDGAHYFHRELHIRQSKL